MKTLFLLSLTAILLQPCEADVIINELVATSSDRQLVRENGQYPRVGNTASWQQPAFNDSLWKSGAGPFGFGNTGVALGTNVSKDVQNRAPSLYLRKKFSATAGNASSTTTLQLAVRYNDGFIAYLNGVEIARRNMGNPGMFAFRDQTAFNTQTDNSVTTINLGQARNFLVAGENTLSIQVHNESVIGTAGNTLLLAADLRLSTGATLSDGNGTWKYLGGNAEPSGGLIDYGMLAASVTPQVPWAKKSFNDSSWQTGTGPVGMETSQSEGYALGVNLAAEMFDITPSVYIRQRFTVTNAEATSAFPLSLNADYDDGIIVYLNGAEIYRRNLGTAGIPVDHDAFADTFRNATGDNGVSIPQDETVSLSAARDLLTSGENVLSIQLHNNSLNSSDAIALVKLSSTGTSARTLVAPTGAVKYFVGTTEPLTENTGEDSADADAESPDSENDWIELKNTGTAPVSIAGWSLSDDPDEPALWTFPPGSTIPANGYIVVIASGLDLTPAEDGTTYFHTNFKLSSTGERVVLSRADGSVASQLTAAYPAQNWRYSYGRQADGTLGFLAAATPGSENSGVALIPAPGVPAFSIEGGFHSGAQSVTLTSATPGATIRFSTDGSDPLNGTTYTSPISISSNRILRARSFLAGAIPSAPVTHTYLINESSARKSLPAIVLGGDQKLTFYGPNASGAPSDGEGILAIKGGQYSGSVWNNNGDTSAFNFPSLRGRAAEKNATLEYLPRAGAPLRTELGIRVSGSGFSRPRYTLTDSPSSIFTPSASSRKPSFNIFFRSEFSDDPIDYPFFFPGNRVTKFENIRLRAGKNDISNPFIKDELLRRTFIATGQEGSVGVLNTLWINGVYKGYYNMTERLREAFMQQHHGSSELWDVQQVNEFSDGDSVNWSQMLAYLRTTDLSTTSGYAGVHDFLDVDNVIDYLLVNAYAAMWDWPNNNWVAARERSSLGRWRFYMWDAEGAFGQNGRNTSYNTFTSDLTLSASEANSTGNQYIPAIYTLLKNSPEFRLRFADRAQKQLFNNGALVNSNMTAIFEQLKDEINPIMQDTIGQTVNENFHNTWIASSTRRNNLFGQMSGQGLWPSTAAPSASQHGGEIASGQQITLSKPNSSGTIYLTTDGTDPRAPGGAITGTAYNGPVTLLETTRVRARILSGGNWSPEIDIAFNVPFSRPTFIPATSADWTNNANWSTDPAPYPNGIGAEAAIPAAPADRNVELRAPVTIGSLVFDQENSEFRNRVRDRSNGNTLTFSSITGAEIIVNGTGTGFVEMDVEAGTILASDLTINTQNNAGDPDNGALRLREGWSGPGGLIKTGPGIASMSGDGKTFTGPVIISQGVLDISQPAAPASSPSITVTPGGQLRLSSGTAEAEPDRVYTFGGPVILSGEGRGAEIADNAGNGKRGALRYETGSGANRAILTNPIQLAGLTDIHVGGTDNRLTLADSVTGSFPFKKSGAGTLKLSGDQSTHTFPINVENGTLETSSTLGSSIELSPTSTLRGYGATAAITGEGRIILPQTVLSAPSSSASAYSFVFGKTGLPSFTESSASTNSAALLSSLPTGLLSIDIYLTNAGDTFEGGLIVPFLQDLSSAISAATVNVFTPDPTGVKTFEGVKWSPLATPWTLTTVAKNLPLAAPFSTSRLLQLRTGATRATDLDDWRTAAFPDPADLADPLISGPLATPFGDGVANLLRYAFGVQPGSPATPKLPVSAISGNSHGLKFPFDSGRDDIIVKVQATEDLNNWNTVLFDSSTDFPPAGDINGMITILDPTPATGKRFYRVMVMEK